MLALLLLPGAAWAAPRDRYDDAAAQVIFPDEAVLRTWRERGVSTKRVLEVALDRKLWAAAFREIEVRLGLFDSRPEVAVSFRDDDDPRAAVSNGRGWKGSIALNLRILVPNQERIDQAAELEKSGRRIVWNIPPMTIRTVVMHELTHLACGSFDEKWFSEGVASYVPADPQCLYGFNQEKRPVEGLDRPTTESDAYARGMALFVWLEVRFGAGAVKELADLVVLRGETPRQGLVRVTRLKWEELVAEELAWSRDYLPKFKPAK
jgi:hypothetical protein